MKPFPLFILLLFLAALALPVTTFSQPQDLTQDSAFFRQQTQLYQAWLDSAGLGATLRVRTLRVEPAFVALYLQFPFSDPDSVSAAWAQLKPAFELQCPVPLERQLFYKLTTLFQLPQDSAQVLIFGNYQYNAAMPNCFKRSIYFSGGRVHVDSSNCMAIGRDIVFKPSDFTRLQKSARLDAKDLAAGRSQPPTPDELRRRYPRDAVFELILEYASRRYHPNRYQHNDELGCEDRYPRLDTLETDLELRFEVFDLCQEIVEDGDPKIEGIFDGFGLEVNWKRREKLIFTVSYKVTPDGFTISCLIDGAVWFWLLSEGAPGRVHSDGR